jgi:glycosyltransferase involved in cell wall biosynthesis
MRLRVLHIIPNFGTGGAERLVVNLLRALDREKFEVAACSLYAKSNTTFEEQLEKSGIMVYYMGKHKSLDLRMIPRLYRLFKAFKPDVVHTHLSVQRYALIPMILCRIPARFHTVHTVAQKEVDVPGKIVNCLAFHFGKVMPVSISQEVAHTVQDLYNVQTPIIYNGIPTEDFQAMLGIRSTWREHEEIKDSEVVFLHVGSFKPAKNHRLLIKAFEQAIKERSNLKLFLAGDGELRPEIEKLVEEKELDQSVRFLGLRNDISELLAACDVFILSSNWEGFGLVIAEAMVAGKPVVATAVGGVPELIEDGVTGILVPPNNPEALASGILRLAKDTNLRLRMGKLAQRRALDRFDIGRTAREYEALYLSLLKEHGRV